MSRVPATPLPRHVFHPKPASARPVIGEPSRLNKYPAWVGKASTRRRQVSASVAEKAAIRAAVRSRSVLMPSQRPSGKALAKQSAAGTKESPEDSNSFAYFRRNAEPANRLRFIAPKSCLKPGSVYSSVRTAPPIV